MNRILFIVAFYLLTAGCGSTPDEMTRTETTAIPSASELRVKRADLLIERKSVEQTLREFDDRVEAATASNDKQAALVAKQLWTAKSPELISTQAKIDEVSQQLGSDVGTSLTEQQRTSQKETLRNHIKDVEQEISDLRKHRQSIGNSSAEEATEDEINIEYGQARIKVWKMLIERLR